MAKSRFSALGNLEQGMGDSSDRSNVSRIGKDGVPELSDRSEPLHRAYAADRALRRGGKKGAKRSRSSNEEEAEISKIAEGKKEKELMEVDQGLGQKEMGLELAGPMNFTMDNAKDLGREEQGLTCQKGRKHQVVFGSMKDLGHELKSSNKAQNGLKVKMNKKKSGLGSEQGKLRPNKEWVKSLYVDKFKKPPNEVIFASEAKENEVEDLNQENHHNGRDNMEQDKDITQEVEEIIKDTDKESMEEEGTDCVREG